MERNYETRIEGSGEGVLRVRRGQRLVAADGTVFEPGEIVPHDHPVLVGNRSRVRSEPAPKGPREPANRRYRRATELERETVTRTPDPVFPLAPTPPEPAADHAPDTDTEKK